MRNSRLCSTLSISCTEYRNWHVHNLPSKIRVCSFVQPLSHVLDSMQGAQHTRPCSQQRDHAEGLVAAYGMQRLAAAQGKCGTNTTRGRHDTNSPMLPCYCLLNYRSGTSALVQLLGPFHTPFVQSSGLFPVTYDLSKKQRAG